MRRFGLVLAASIAATFGFATMASAATALPTPIGSIGLDGPEGYTETDIYSGATYSESWAYYTNTGSVTLMPSPGVYGSATNAGNTNVSVSYYFAVDGAPNTMVPIEIQFTLETTALGTDALASAFIGVSGIYPGAGALACSSAGGWRGQCPSDSMGGSVIGGSFFGDVMSNTPIPITLEANAAAYTLGPLDNSFASATADPIITVLNDGFSLDLLPGVGNSIGGVPEPATWTMLILGVAMIGFAARRRNALAGVTA